MTHTSGRTGLLTAMREPNTGLIQLRSLPKPPVAEPKTPAAAQKAPAAPSATKARFKAALFDENGMILTLVSPGFGMLRGNAQPAMVAKLQEAAKAAGLFGTVVPVWKTRDAFEFVAPSIFTPLLKSLQWTEILERVDCEFSC